MTSDAELVEALILAARDAETQLHFGNAGSRHHAEAELESASKALISRLSPEVRDGELLPCPFCAADAGLAKGKSAILCTSCLAEGPATTPEGIAELWNTRAPSISRDTEVTEALTDARGAIASLDEDALGIVRQHPSGDLDSGYAYPIRDELLAKIDKALAMSAEASDHP